MPSYVVAYLMFVLVVFVYSRNTPIVSLALHWHDHSDERHFAECVSVCVLG